MVELYLHSPISLQGLVLNYITKYSDKFIFISPSAHTFHSFQFDSRYPWRFRNVSSRWLQYLSPQLWGQRSEQSSWAPVSTGRGASGAEISPSVIILSHVDTRVIKPWPELLGQIVLIDNNKSCYHNLGYI
jgi:hypothetical protein